MTAPGAIVRRSAALAALALGLSACSPVTTPILHPAGPIALAERDILFRAFAIMLVVVVPVIVMAFWVAWRYRASAPSARYEPNWMSARLDAAIWFVPVLIVGSLAVHVWIYTHRLDPYRPLAGPSPVEVEVIAQDWKWLFVYPDQQVAAVNELAFPSGVPVRLKITSDTVMNSFFIPALAGQIYAMAGMQSELNLRADRPGRYVGRNTQYSGDGFPDQHFVALALSAEDFDAWLAKARQGGTRLDAAAYAALAEPSQAQPVSYYGAVDGGLFHSVMGKYMTRVANPSRNAQGGTPNME